GHRSPGAVGPAPRWRRSRPALARFTGRPDSDGRGGSRTGRPVTSMVSLGSRLSAADLARQMAHWQAAATIFRDAEEFASADAWRSVEGEVGLPLRRQLGVAVEDLLKFGRETMALVARARIDTAPLPAAARAGQT